MKQDKHNKPINSIKSESYRHRSHLTIHTGGNRDKQGIKINDKREEAGSKKL
jgi:hypothetical protein